MIFEALKDKPRGVIISTDIGPDCDDAGAIALLHEYSKEYSFPILGMINCTTNPNGTRTLYALNKFVEKSDIPLGQWGGEPLFESADSSHYTAEIAERFGAGAPTPEDSTVLYRRLLSEAEDDSVVIITIGMFTDLSALLTSDPDGISDLTGAQLVEKKVAYVVSMATNNMTREFNIRWAPDAARRVLEDIPCDMYIADFWLGKRVNTGFDPEADKRDNPYYEAYRLYPYNAPLQNASFDLVAVQFAVLGEGELYKLGDRGRLHFFECDKSPEGVCDATEFLSDKDGRLTLIAKASTDEALAASINEVLARILEY